MAGVLNFSDYLGGPDNVQCEQIFPGDQKLLQYNFGVNITNWTFKVEAQTIVVNPLTFDRDGTPNFATSQVIGYFAPTTIADTSVSTSTYVHSVNPTGGIVDITVPKNLYTGPILPDARQNVPITVVSVSWTGIPNSTTGDPAPTSTHRWAFIQCWQPGVTPGDPTVQSVSTVITDWTIDPAAYGGHSLAEYLYVADTAGILPGATFAINSQTCIVSTVDSGIKITPVYNPPSTLPPYGENLVVGQPVTFYNYTGYYSLI